MEDELTQRLLFFGDDADAAFDAVIKDEMVQHDAVEVSTEDTQHHGLFIVDQGRGKRHTHSRQRHGFSQFHVQVLVHDLCHDIQPAGGCIAVEQNTQPDADHQNIAQHVQLLTAGHRAELREQLFKQPQKHRQQHTGVYGLCAKFSAAGKEPDDEKHDVQDHRNDRQGQRHKIGQHDAKAGNAADGCMARHQKKENARRNDRHRPGQDCRLPQDCAGLSFYIIHLCPPKIKFVSPNSSSLSMRTRSLPPKRLYSIVKYLHKFRVAVLSIPCFSLAEKIAKQKCPRRACCGSPGASYVRV